jgi:hypothetical protein
MFEIPVSLNYLKGSLLKGRGGYEKLYTDSVLVVFRTSMFIRKTKSTT